MASGRQDYWYAMLPGKSVYGTAQTYWFKYNNLEIETGDVEDFFDYKVPVGYTLQVCGGIYSCDSPGYFDLTFLIDDNVKFIFNVDNILYMPFNSEAPVVVNEGETLRMRIKNTDTITISANLTLFGFLYYKLS